MRLDRYISKTRIIDVVSRDFEGALKELLEVCKIDAGLDRKKLLADLISREKTMTTYLGSGIALPHIRLPMKRNYIFAIGRCPDGMEFEGHEEYRDLRLIFLLLASEGENSYLNVLASLARTFQEPTTVEMLTDSPDIDTLRKSVSVAFGKGPDKKRTKDNKFNRLILREAQKVASGAKCSSVLIFGDTFAGGVDVADQFDNFKTILVTQSGSEASLDKKSFNAVIPVRSFSSNRLSQLRSAMLIGLTRGILKHNERICCVGGIPQTNQFDTLVVVDVEREFQSVFTRQADMLPATVKPEVLERVLAIATELSVEGREGRPVGCLFVLGDVAQVKPHIKQLVLNPFYGYDEEERNILNPFMDETVKEYSSLDGAFTIKGDGALESAGSLIHAPNYPSQLPSGLGSRHAAGAAISIAADCIAIVVSESTGQVTLFRRGQLLPLIERGVGREV
ncbi:PTS sugar transporter subunit IIA [Rubellicoccus peritrichatus]|uniref:PTS sugar transporter subunit IIA n=1 Tax=Rubellicoccus peritrichatus TaxID=3080537 RepID=A0AAQ3LC92_9BACT|nr:PTS sugar transporter subunit IIA [Puniceicoccus sp. CR14]WOO41200.1 PTS sugar transporter subunit IIA [Puniceicoccus sp. CR14]